MGQMIALLSGVLMSVQGVFNTRLREKAGNWGTNVIVHGVGFFTSVLILFFVRDINLTGLKAVNKWYLLGGVLGVGIIYTVIIAIGKLGPAQTTMLILVSQLIASYLIELFGWFETEKVPFSWMKVLSIGIIIAGIIMFQSVKK